MNATESATDTARRMINLASRTPVEIDTALAALDTEHYRLTVRLAATLNTVHGAAGDRHVHSAGHGRWTMTDADAIATLADKIEHGTVSLTYAASAPRTMANLNALRDTIAANRAEFDRLDAEHDRRRWSRFIVVEHVHSGYHCAGGTLDRGKYRSERHWLPEYSGRSEAEAIAELAGQAHTLCTHCFPSAPVVTPTVDPSVCPSRTADWDKPKRTRGAYGNWATCKTCGAQASLTSAGNLRKHKRPTTNDTQEGDAR